MADQIEEIYKSFIEAVELYNQAMETITGGMNQLRSAEHKLEAALNDFSQYVGEQEYSSEPGIDGGLSLIGRLSKGTKSVGDFFDISSLF
jgi:hypothetical protein